MKKINKMIKNLSPTMKLLIILCIMIGLAVGYTTLIYKPTEAKMGTLNTEIENLNDEIEMNKQKQKKLESMQAALNDPEYTYQKIGTYSAQPDVMRFLSDISKVFLKDTTNNNKVQAWSQDGIDVAKLVDKNTGLYVRTVKLTFSTSTYTEAKQVIADLYKYDHMNMITDVTIDGSPNQNDITKVVVTVVFFEKDYNYKKPASKTDD